jgi:ribosomal protein S18 acetylase RimI-like enzyme
MTGSALTLRASVPADRPFLLALYAGTRADEFAPLGWPAEIERSFMAMQFDAQRADYERRYPGSPCQVVEVGGHAVGRLWVARDAERLTLLDISLVPQMRGQGIGTHCLRRVQRRAEAAGLAVELQVVRGNPAQRLYERLGFRDVGESGVRQAMAWRPAAGRIDHPEEMHHEQA